MLPGDDLVERPRVELDTQARGCVQRQRDVRVKGLYEYRLLDLEKLTERIKRSVLGGYNGILSLRQEHRTAHLHRETGL